MIACSSREDKILIRTESGAWSREVERNDEMFRDLIDPYTELGTTPSEIVLSGVVGQVIETQWPKYEAMLEYRNFVMQLDPDCSKRGETRAIMEALLGRKATESPSSPPLVKLSEFSALSNILNLPQDWTLWVYVDEDVSDVLYARHVRAMGYAIMRTGDSSYSEMDKDRAWRNSKFVAGLLMEGIDRYVWELRLIMENEQYDELKAIVRGTMRNAVLRSIARDNQAAYLDWRLINYRALYHSLRDALPAGVRTDIILNTLLMWMGGGDYRKKTFRGPICLDAYGVVCYDESLSSMYDLIIKSFPEDVDPILLGLEPIIANHHKKLAHPDTMGISPLAWWVSWVHHQTLEFAENKTESLSVEQFPAAVEFFLMSTPGLPGLEFIVRVLTNYDPEGKNERITRFLTVVKERLSKPYIPKLRVRLSTRYANIRMLYESIPRESVADDWLRR